MVLLVYVYIIGFLFFICGFGSVLFLWNLSFFVFLNILINFVLYIYIIFELISFVFVGKIFIN